MPAVYVLWIAGGWLFTMLALPGANYAKLDHEQHQIYHRAEDQHFRVECVVCKETLFQCEKITTDREVVRRICKRCLNGE